MKILLLFAFLLSLLTTFKDLSKGYSDNKIDVIFDIIVSILTFVPLVINAIIFFRGNLNHFLIIKQQFWIHVLLDYGDRWRQKYMEKGLTYFCNQCFDEPQYIRNDINTLTLNGTKEETIHLCLSDTSWFHFMIDQELVDDMRSTMPQSYDELISAVETNIGKFLEINVQENLFEANFYTHGYPGQTLKLNTPNKGFGLKIKWVIMKLTMPRYAYKTVIGKLGISIRGSCFSVKHVDNKIDDGFVFNIGKLSRKKIIKLLTVLEFWSKNPEIGIIDGDPVTRRGEVVFHCLRIFEIFTGLQEKRELRMVSLPGGFFVESDSSGPDLSKSMEPWINNRITESDLSGRIELEMESVDSLIDAEFFFKELSPKIGFSLTRFIFDFSFDHFKGLNCDALNYVLRRNSCRNYKLIGPNWKSKRFLAGLNFIYEVSGLPRLTRFDKNVRPPQRLIKMQGLIPKAICKIEREFCHYDKLKEIEEIDKKIDQGVGKKEKKTLNNLRRSIQNHCVRPLGVNKKVIRKFLETKKEKVSETSDYNFYRKYSDENETRYEQHHMNYKKALMKNNPPENTKDMVKADKVVEKIRLHKVKSSGIKEVINLRERIVEIKKSKGKSFTHKGKPYKLVDEIAIENYYGVLNKYIDDFNNECDPELNENQIDKEMVLLMIIRKLEGFDLNKKGVKKIILKYFSAGGYYLNPYLNAIYKRVFGKTKASIYAISADSAFEEIIKRTCDEHLQTKVQIKRLRTEKERKTKNDREREISSEWGLKYYYSTGKIARESKEKEIKERARRLARETKKSNKRKVTGDKEKEKMNEDDGSKGDNAAKKRRINETAIRETDILPLLEMVKRENKGKKGMEETGVEGKRVSRVVRKKQYTPEEIEEDRGKFLKVLKSRIRSAKKKGEYFFRKNGGGAEGEEDIEEFHAPGYEFNDILERPERLCKFKNETFIYGGWIFKTIDFCYKISEKEGTIFRREYLRLLSTGVIDEEKVYSFRNC